MFLNRIDLGGKRARYEELTDTHHDHLIDIETGDIIEFVDDEIEELQKKVAKKLGYSLIDHKMELFGKKIKSNLKVKEEIWQSQKILTLYL